VPNFTRYGNIKGVSKCSKWGGLGWWLGVTQAYQQCRHSIERILINQSKFIFQVITENCNVINAVADTLKATRKALRSIKLVA